MFKYASLFVAFLAAATVLADTNATDSTPSTVAPLVSAVVDAGNITTTSNASIPLANVTAPLANVTAAVADDDHEELSAGKKAAKPKPEVKKPVAPPAAPADKTADEMPLAVAPEETPKVDAKEETKDEVETSSEGAVANTTVSQVEEVSTEQTVFRPAQGADPTHKPMSLGKKEIKNEIIKAAENKAKDGNGSGSASVLLIGALVALLGAAF